MPSRQSVTSPKGGTWKSIEIPLVLVAMLFSSQSAVARSAASEVPTENSRELVNEYRSFLNDKFGISFTGAPSRGDFIHALALGLGYKAEKDGAPAFTDVSPTDALYEAVAALYQKGIISETTVAPTDPLTAEEAISLAIKAADLEELADTYATAKAEKALVVADISAAGFSQPALKDLAVAVDTDLIPKGFLKHLAATAVVDEELANILVGKVLEIKGKYKNYVGSVSDPEIYAKITHAYYSSDAFHAPKLEALVNKAVDDGLISGYNIKDLRLDSNFIKSLTLTYGHSDLTHAVQLIALLRSEGLDAKIQYEPKTSAYRHHADWGAPGPNAVKSANGNYIVYAKEYDLDFEFRTAADKEAFEAVIVAYAKKDDENEKGLIAHSWWQPLYFSQTGLKGYEAITNNLIKDPDGIYTASPFSLNSESARVVAGLKTIDPQAVIVPYQFWVDKPFFNYMNGEGK